MSEIQNSVDSVNNFSKNRSNDKKIRELEEKKILLEKKHEFLNHKIDVLKQANGFGISVASPTMNATFNMDLEMKPPPGPQSTTVG